MHNQADNIECPAMPAWLAEPERILAEEDSTFCELPPHIQSLFNIYEEARRGDYQAAEKLAIKFESGDVPCGPDLELAMTWHRYAVQLGSASSALRLAELLVWSLYEDGASGGVLMAQRALEIILENRYIDKTDWHTAAAAALFLLQREPDVMALCLIEDLLNQKRFADHPDCERIARALRLSNSQAGHDPLSLKVAQSKIGEDGGFKLGIYKCLESPLPLAPLPFDTDAILKVLNQEFPWFSKINEQVYRQMVVGQHSTTPAFHIRPLLLAGLPGVGKTTWAKRLGELCKVPFRTVMAGGGADSMFLRGTPRGWSSARPGRLRPIRWSLPSGTPHGREPCSPSHASGMC